MTRPPGPLPPPAVDFASRRLPLVEAKGPLFRLHDARHTAATLLYEASQDLRLVQKQLGHSRPSITAVYADVCDEKARQGVAAMEQLAKRTMKGNGPREVAEPVPLSAAVEVAAGI